MEGSAVRITKEWLLEKDAFAEVLKWFRENHPDGCELQELLDELAATEVHDDWCQWLLAEVGNIDTEVRIEGNLESEHSIFVAGRLIVSGSIRVNGWLAGRWIEAGEWIEAGLGIKAGRWINAGEWIEAGLGINAGEWIEAGRWIKAGEWIEAGLGIKAGLGIEASRGIKAGLGIEAGRGIKAGLGIKAGEWIKAGRWIKAGEWIEAGSDWGVYAGLSMPLSTGAMCVCKTRPKNLICGVWEPNEATEEAVDDGHK
jgi:hypothetical protein